MSVVNFDFAAGEDVMPDRRESAFNDPRFWVSVTSVLLVISLAVLGFIANQLASISGDVRAVVVASTGQGKDIESLQKENDDIKRELAATRLRIDDMEKRHQDYSAATMKDMREIVTILRMSGIDTSGISKK